jgi:hypothetical protein
MLSLRSSAAFFVALTTGLSSVTPTAQADVARKVAVTPMAMATLKSPVALISDTNPYTYNDFFFRAQQLAQQWCAEDQLDKRFKPENALMQKCQPGAFAGTWEIRKATEVIENYYYRFSILRWGNWAVDKWGTPQCHVKSHWEQWRWVWIRAQHGVYNGRVEWRLDDRRREKPIMKLPIPGSKGAWIGYIQKPFLPTGG